MRKSNAILIQFTLGTFAIVAIASLILGYFLTQFIVDQQIRKHIDLYPEIVNEEVLSFPQIKAIFEDDGYKTPPNELNEFTRSLMSFGKVFRIKIWSKDSLVVWSDEKDLIGKTFIDNTLYSEAFKGKITYEVSKPTTAEQVTESSKNQVIEIYTPVKDQNKVIGVVELYESTDGLIEDVQQTKSNIWKMVALSGFCIYVLLFGVYYRAQKKQNETNDEILHTQEVTIQALAAIAETRDNETGEHLTRTQNFIELLALKYNVSKQGPYLSPERIEIIKKSSILHDIGKVGVPDAILLKPGKLTPEEFEIMKLHPKYGRDALLSATQSLGSNSFLETAMEIAYAHHEKWDGSGYPEGLSGSSIPLSARLMALADVYDALVNKRVYKEAFSHEYALNIIREGRGKHFDPLLTDLFIQYEAEFEALLK